MEWSAELTTRRESLQNILRMKYIRRAKHRGSATSTNRLTSDAGHQIISGIARVKNAHVVSGVTMSRCRLAKMTRSSWTSGQIAFIDGVFFVSGGINRNQSWFRSANKVHVLDTLRMRYGRLFNENCRQKPSHEAGHLQHSVSHFAGSVVGNRGSYPRNVPEVHLALTMPNRVPKSFNETYMYRNHFLSSRLYHARIVLLQDLFGGRKCSKLA